MRNTLLANNFEQGDYYIDININIQASEFYSHCIVAQSVKNIQGKGMYHV